MKYNYPYPVSKRVLSNEKEKDLKKTTNKTFKTFGMLFENELNSSNDYYNHNNIALIYKKPTPVQVVKVDYPSRNKAKIIEAYYKTPSTTDYNGIYKGKYIDYEAKETIKDYFPFAHIKEHQINHLVKATHHGGITFIIIYYRTQNIIVLIDFAVFYKLYTEGSSKSITYQKALEVGHLINLSYRPSIDYIKVVDKIYNI